MGYNAKEQPESALSRENLIQGRISVGNWFDMAGRRWEQLCEKERRIMYEHEFEEQRKRLGNRSSKIIGGYVTEHLFIQTFVKNRALYSDSWWFSRAKSGREFWFIEKTDLSVLDWEIIRMLQAENQQCYQLYRVSGVWNIVRPDTGWRWKIGTFVEENQLEEIQKSRRAVDHSEDEIAQLKKCIEYYKEENILEDIERSIGIEDLFLNRYFYTSNIDLFVGAAEGDGIMPVCLEIKFKDEFSYKGVSYFGIDCYQMKGEYSILERTGMKIFNVILYNDRRNKTRKTTTNIFDFLEQCGEKQWIYVRVSGLVKYRKYHMQSLKTGFTGVQRKSRSVYCIPAFLYAGLTDLEQIFQNNYIPDCDGQVFAYDNHTGKERCPVCGGILEKREGR